MFDKSFKTERTYPIKAVVIDKLTRLSEINNGCLVWTGAKHQGKGYGIVTVPLEDGTTLTLYVHRLAAWLYIKNFDIYSDLAVAHICDNPPCFLTEHLKPGTDSDNMMDASRKGRLANSNVTHCVYGHEYTVENTYINPGSGKRQCRQCLKIKESKRVRDYKQMYQSRRDIKEFLRDE